MNSSTVQHSPRPPGRHRAVGVLPDLELPAARNPRSTTADVQSVHIPEIGWVRWTVEQIDAHAAEVACRHEPVRNLRTWRSWKIWPFRSKDPSQCRFCGEDWPCRSTGWSTWWTGGGRST